MQWAALTVRGARVMSSPMRRPPAALALAFVAATPSMARVVVPFPDAFLWGTAISGFQSDMGQGARPLKTIAAKSGITSKLGRQFGP